MRSRRVFAGAFISLIMMAAFLSPLQASIPIDITKEFTEKVFTGQSAWGPVTLYGAWINVSGAEVLYLAFVSWSIVDWFIGFHYTSVNGSDVFVGNTFTAFEIFNDTNHNGIVDAPNNTAQPTELAGYLGNFTVSQYTINHIQKTTLNGVDHYQWGIDYAGQALELDRTGAFMGTFFNFRSLSFNYDYYVNASTAHLKSSLRLVPTQTYSQFNGLGLAAGYTATTLVVSQSGTAGNCNTYADRTNGVYSVCAGQRPSFGGLLKDVTVHVGSSGVFEYRFGSDYTLTTGGSNSTHTSTASMVPPDGAPPAAGAPEAIVSVMNMEQFARDYAQLVIPNANQLNLTFAFASLLYRVSYPVWSSGAVQHDPEMIAYLKGSSGSPIMLPSFNATNLYLFVLLGSVILAFASYRFFKVRRVLLPLPTLG